MSFSLDQFPNRQREEYERARVEAPEIAVCMLECGCDFEDAAQYLATIAPDDPNNPWHPSMGFITY